MAAIPLAILFMIILRFVPARSPKAAAEELANRQAALKDKNQQEIKVARPM
jgi:hypothetical protein